MIIAKYDNFERRAERRPELRENLEWEAYAGSVRPLIRKEENLLLLPGSHRASPLDSDQWCRSLPL